MIDLPYNFPPAKMMELCNLILDNFDGVSAESWLKREDYVLGEMTEDDADKLIEELKTYERKRSDS